MLKSYNQFLGKRLRVIVDRPIGSKHPTYDFLYPVNYGYIPDTQAGDGEEVDAYILGLEDPVLEFFGVCIAVVHRSNDNEDKLVVAPEGKQYTEEEIKKAVEFQEQFFQSTIFVEQKLRSRDY